MPLVASVTQAGMLFVSAGALVYQNSAGTTATMINSAGQKSIIGAIYSTTGTLGEMVIGTSGGVVRLLAPGSSGQIIVASTGGSGVVWASNNAEFGVHVDYGTSLTTGTSVPNASVKCYRGRATLTSGVATISGLGFANATSYSVSAIRVNTLHTEAVFATDLSGSSFTINGNLSNSDIVSWVAIGS